MSEKFNNRLILHLKVSWALMAALLFLHLGAMTLVVIVPLDPAAKIGLGVALGMSLIQSTGVHGLRRRRSAVTELELDSEDLCSVRLYGREEWLPCRVSRSLLHPWVSVLVLRIEGRRRPLGLVLPADAVEPDAFRRLRARLRLQTAAA